ncbi:MAG: sigma-54-dependent Fis family transcriptional regulator [Phycisphaerales bacterium]|nr:MAG: sigma-54-dependent Fis family transcriptional regulator [Phycisphaerales bacterium]
MLVRVLLLTNSPRLRHRLSRLLDDLDITLTHTGGRKVFWDRVTQEPADLVIVSRSCLPDPIEETVAVIRGLPDRPDLLVVWDEEDPEERARLLIAGCFAVLFEGLPDETLREAIQSFVVRRRDASVDRIRREIAETEYRLTDFDSPNPAMKSFMNVVRRVVEPDSSLLILGETGVGKERLARAIHAESPRASEPFIPVNCAALPETLLDAELFGHVKGAFTGASGDRRGYFELAHCGTVFLDEIGELPKHLQIKLLRVLQERMIQRLGSEEPIAVDVRIMAASNRDLEQEIDQNRFRRDLYYRLGVVTLEVPPLREHPEDIPHLLEQYLQEFRARFGRPVASFSREAMDILGRYRWPGNIRELINVVERAVILSQGVVLTVSDLPRVLVEQCTAGSLPAVGSCVTVSGLAVASEDLLTKPWKNMRRQVLGYLEQAYLVRQLTKAHGRVNDAAENSGVSPRTLYEMMKRHSLRKEDYRTKKRPRSS